jgi:hypothetical protein
MYESSSSERETVRGRRGGFARVWADIVHGQRRAAELNTPWIARRRATNSKADSAYWTP